MFRKVILDLYFYDMYLPYDILTKIIDSNIVRFCTSATRVISFVSFRTGTRTKPETVRNFRILADRKNHMIVGVNQIDPQKPLEYERGVSLYM
jgi:hypothetical protein